MIRATATDVVKAVSDLADEAIRQYQRAETAHDQKDEANRRWLASQQELNATRLALTQLQESFNTEIARVRDEAYQHGYKTARWELTEQ